MEPESDTSSPTTICFTCLHRTQKHLSILDNVNDLVAELLIQHFWFQQDDFSTEHGLCQPCWNQLETFHQFYQEVKHNHLGASLEPLCDIKQEDNEESPTKSVEEEQTHPPLEVEGIFVQAEIKEEEESEEEEAETKPQNSEADDDPKPASLGIYKTPQRVKELGEKRKARYALKTAEEIEDYTEEEEVETTPQHSEADDSEANLSDSKDQPKPVSKRRYTKRQKVEESAVKLKTRYALRRLEEDSEEEEVETESQRHSETEETVEDTAYLPKRSYKKRQNTATKQSTEKRKTAEELAKDDAIINSHVQYSCEVCGILQPSFTRFLKHMERMHQQTGAITCCGKRYHKKPDLLAHVLRLDNPELFKCDICQKSFINSHAVERHKRKMHVPDELKVFRCDRCPKRFVQEDQLEYHLKRHENVDNKTLKCPECDKLFETELYLSKHIKRHTRPTDFICDICAEGFYSKSEFLWHTKQHELQGQDIRVQCDICKTWLKNRQTLRKHQQRHKADPVTCDLCGHVAPNNDALSAHRWYRHKERKRETEYNHVCQECGKKYSRASTLQDHMASHIGEAQYSCTFCDRTFYSSANMFSHRKRMHPKEWLELKNAKRGVVPSEPDQGEEAK